MKHAIMAGLLLLLAMAAKADTGLSPQAVVAQRGKAALTVALVDQKIAAMPAGIRADYLDDPQRMARLIDSMLLLIQLATEADAAGIKAELPAQGDELDRMTAKANALLRAKGVLLADDDYRPLARERYLARKKEYASPPAFALQHVFVDGRARGPIAARVIADGVRQKALDGEDFAALVQTYSEQKPDPLNATLDLGAVMQLNPALKQGLLTLGKRPGISEVIPAEDGVSFHLLRLVEYIAPAIPPFEAVEGRIIEQLKEEASQAARTTFMRDLSQQEVDINGPVMRQLNARYYQKYGPVQEE